MRFGVGGGKGLSELTTADDDAPKASPVFEAFLFLGSFGVSKVIDLMNVTWHISGYKQQLFVSTTITTHLGGKGRNIPPYY